MTIEQENLPNGESHRPENASAEAKRMAARRRFLARGAAGGSGLLIVTLCHQRAIARRPGALEHNDPRKAVAPATQQQDTTQPTQQGILVSSELMCQSLGGHLNGNQFLSVDGSTVRFDCEGTTRRT